MSASRLATAVLLLLCSLSQAREVLRFAIDAHNPPFMYVDGQGVAQGLYAQTLRQLGERAGLTLRIEAIPWKRALAYLEQGSHGVAGIYRNEERQRKYLFSRPIYREELVVYARKGHAMAPYSGIASLYGKRVGVLSGWFYSDAFSRARDEKRLLADEAARDAQNVDKLRLGRLDYLIGIRESIAALNHGELEEAGILASNLTYIALPDSPRSRLLLQQLNPYIADLPDKARAP